MSPRADAHKSLKEACQRRGLELEVISSHDTPKRPMRNGAVEWLDVTVTEPGTTTQVHCSTINGNEATAFLKATLAEVVKTWPLSTKGGPNATRQSRQAKRARIAAEQACARGVA